MATWRDDVMPWSDVRLGRTRGGGPSRVGTGHFPSRADERRQRDGRPRPERFHAVLPQRRPTKTLRLRRRTGRGSISRRRTHSADSSEILGDASGDVGRQVGRLHRHSAATTCLSADCPAALSHVSRLIVRPRCHMSLRRLSSCAVVTPRPELDLTRAPRARRYWPADDWWPHSIREPFGQKKAHDA